MARDSLLREFLAYLGLCAWATVHRDGGWLLQQHVLTGETRDAWDAGVGPPDGSCPPWFGRSTAAATPRPSIPPPERAEAA